MSDSVAAGHANPRLVSVFSNVGHTCTHMFTILYATAVLHLPGEFGLPFGEMLGLASFGMVLYGVCALPAGWFADRWSQVGMMVLFFIGIGAGSIVTGLGESKNDLFWGLTLIGAFAAIYHPVGIAWLVAVARRQGMTLGINGVFGSLGSALAPLFVGLMIDYVTWRAAFIVPGIVAVAFGVALAVCWKRGVLSDARSDRAPQSGAPDSAAMRKVFAILTLTMCASGFVYSGLITTMPKLFETGLGDDLAMSYTEIGAYVGAVIGFASLSSILGGWLADRYAARNIYMVFWLLTVPPVFAMTSSTGAILLVVALLAMFFNTTFAAAENLLVARYTPFKWRSLAYGAKFVLALGVGGLTVKLAGDVFDRTGDFDGLYVAFCIAGIAAALAAWLLPKAPQTGRTDATQPAAAE